MHKQNFKDPQSSKCQVSSKRTVLDMESEVNQMLGFNPHWGGNILSLIFFLFSHSKVSLMPILDLLPMFCVCETPGWLFPARGQAL